MKNYYVYAYLRESDNTPYYIGKGADDRAFRQHKKSDHSGISTPTDRSKIVFLETNLTELGALALERRYIRWYGRKDQGTGILRNMTDGGDGTSGYKQSQSAKDKIGAASKLRKRAPMSQERKDEVSKKHTGKVISEETKEKIQKANLGKPKNKRQKI